LVDVEAVEVPSRVTDRPPRDRPQEADVRPFHARDVSTGQEAAELVAATLKHAAEREEAARAKAVPKQQPKWMLPVGLNLGVLAAYLLIAPPAWIVVNPIAPPPEAEALADLRAGMWMQAQKIEGYRMRTGRLPATLAEAGVSVTGLDYMPQGDSYVLIASVSPGAEPLVFNSAVHTLNEWAGDLSVHIGG
jgi:hypothetical protein